MNSMLNTFLQMPPSGFLQGINQSLPQQSALLNGWMKARNVGSNFLRNRPAGGGSTVTRGNNSPLGTLNPLPAMTHPAFGSNPAFNPAANSNPLANTGAGGNQTQLHPLLNMLSRFRQFQNPTAQVAGQHTGSLLQSVLSRVSGSGGWDFGGQSGGGGSAPGAPGSNMGGGGSPQGGGLLPTGGLGTTEGSYGPLAGWIFQHTPQTVLMSGGPMYQAARDYYLGPERPSFAAVH